MNHAKLAPEEMVPLMRLLLDTHDPYELLNDLGLRQSMRVFVRSAEAHPRSGSLTRLELSVQVFAFAARLERERMCSQVSRGTWPGHDEAMVEELVLS